MLTFGQRLKAIRKSARLTQAELAERLMVSVQSISKWECGSTMPDISQIVPLSAVLGVTTDCLLGAGGDEKADREALFEEARRISKGIDRVYSREDNAYCELYRLYKRHLKKYPFDYEIKLQCADSIVRLVYYGQDGETEKDRLFEEGIGLLTSIINYDRDTTRIIDAKQTLIILYLYHDDFARAEETAESLPQRGSIRALMEIEIYSRKNDHDKCVEISNRICEEAVHHYLRALAIRARKLSSLGGAGKQEAIGAWRNLLEGARLNYEMSGDTKINTKWRYSALNHLANEYIAMDQTDKALEVIEELAELLILHYREQKEKGESTAAEELKSNFRFYLHGCYNSRFQTQDNIITNDPRFKKCERMLEAAD